MKAVYRNGCFRSKVEIIVLDDHFYATDAVKREHMLNDGSIFP